MGDCLHNQIGLDPPIITRSAAQLTAGLAAAARIVPRLLNGTPQSTGQVVFASVGMSNTSNVWAGFRARLNQAGTAPASLKWFDGTKGGHGAPQWADPDDECWTEMTSQLTQRGFSSAQVQAIFMMLVTPFPDQTPEANAVRYQSDVLTILDLLEQRFPNLQIVYLSGNYYGGYDEGQNKTPEPHGYLENGTLQAIQDEYSGRLWVSASSTMLWADGIRPRVWDGLTLLCPADVTNGGVHLSAVGKTKYGRWLYDALMADPTTAGWMR